MSSFVRGGSLTLLAITDRGLYTSRQEANLQPKNQENRVKPTESKPKRKFGFQRKEPLKRATGVY